MLILFVNVMLNLLVIYKLFTMFNIEHYKEYSTFNKPLFKMMVQIYVPTILPVLCTIGIVHFFFIGPELIQLLDIYHHVYNNRKSKLIVLLLIICFNINFIVCFFPLIVSLISEPKIQLFDLYGYYVLSIHDFIFWSIIFYYKYGTYRTLTNLHQYLSEKLPIFNVDDYSKNIPELIERLAQNNRCLNKLLSICLLIFFVCNGAFYLITISLLLMQNIIYDFVINMILVFCCLLCCVHITKQADYSLREIGQLLSKYQWKLYIHSYGTHKLVPFGTKPGKVIFQYSIYREYFQLKLFDCLIFDQQFVLYFVIFIMTNVLIIIQTN